MRTEKEREGPIPAWVHGVFDYVGGIALILAPNIFGFADLGGPAVVIPRIIGVLVLVQAMLTAYEVGIVKIIPMSMHLMNDYVASIFLAISPWLFGFNNNSPRVWMPHVIVGLAVFVVSLLTEKHPRIEARPHHQAV